jgi:sterol desaturase/sphingolipid hydroxylase (fatty acid hydroxylase superfamily)
MTMWSDNRNHLLDDVQVSVLLVLLAQLMGVAPEQFVAIVALTQLSESLQHANLRLSFGRIGERLWVSPQFHRVHHSVHLADCNYGVLLPWWDQLFGTANFQTHSDPTGVQDAQGLMLDDGTGFWQQQWQGLKRLWGRA